MSGCSGTKNLTALSELTVENKLLNKLIVNRKPEYGINGKDGCVVMNEISMDIAELQNGKSIRGKVFDSKTKVPLINADLTLTTDQNGSNNVTEIKTDENGNWKSVLKGNLKKIKVEYITYRALNIELNKL